MSKALVLAEKPSVGRDIARVLGCQSKGQGMAENNRYIVTWAMGHLVTLASPEKYQLKFSDWNLNNMPVVPKPFKLEVIGKTGKQYSLVRKLLERKDVTEVIIATDAGREGELVARWILDYAHCKKPIKRLWISSVTDKAIKTGFNQLVDGKKYNDLYYAAKARAQADWILGLNGTKALSVKHNASLSMGRVQTPTLNLIREREQVIQQFKPQSYYELSCQIEGVKCQILAKNAASSRLYDKEVAERILSQVKGKSVTISGVKTKDKQSSKEGFYDLTELQRDANRLYGFSAKETLNTMQTLYERHKVLTYPRTDSKYITEDIVPTLKERLMACRTSQTQGLIQTIIKKGIQSRKSFVNPAKVGDHHGIIPTEESPDFSDFSPKEQKIYLLVANRFVAALAPSYRYKEHTIEGSLASYEVKGKLTEVVDLGWKALYEDEKVASKTMPQIKVGQALEVEQVQMKTGKTEPPSLLDEGSLLQQMEQGGLGTVATRADIIEKIIRNAYVDKVGKHLKTTKTGKQLLDLVPDQMRSKALTAKWEKDLELIAKGKKNASSFMNELTDFTKEVIEAIKSDDTQFKYDNVSSESCPNCGQKLLMVNNKYGKKLVCRDRDCGYKKNISKVTNARCPECHKKMELVGQGDTQTFVCKCGHKEKLTSFEKRKKENGGKVSKKDVNSYMKKQGKKEENFNNPFASLLKDLDKSGPPA